MLLHTILPRRGRLASLGAVVDGPCANCGGCEDVPHFLQCCSCVSDLWDSLCVKLLAVVPGFPSDLDLLMLAFPVCPAPVEKLAVAHLGFLVAELWESSALL